MHGSDPMPAAPLRSEGPVLVVDNYDSFTYNLVALLRTLGQEVVVWRNDQFGLEDARQLSPQRLLISPGPGLPRNSGVSPRLVEAFWEQIPILGVCLGHQMLAEIAGGHVVAAREPRHGKTSPLAHTDTSVFAGIPQGAPVMRYHSWVVQPGTLPGELIPIAWSEDTGELMALRHRTLPIVGVQFHPESVLTACGPQIVRNWLTLDAVPQAASVQRAC